MMRLVKLGLIYGNLMEVRSPSMVSRYNRALEYLTGKRTQLTEFHVDISGYSPEIGDEFEDENYLNQHGCNRQFILLNVAQKTAPLLNAHFSTSRSILRQYIDEHEEQLFALTVRDAVVGELDNTIFVLNSPADLFHLRQIDVEADTVGRHVEAGDELGDKIEQFLRAEDSWWDDVLISEMIELSKQTGDIIRSPITLKSKSYRKGNFHTKHFGGLYVFKDLADPTCITKDETVDRDELPVSTVMTLKDHSDIASFLNQNALVEPITNAPNAISILKQKRDFIVIDTLANLEVSFEDVSRRSLRHLKRKYYKHLPDEYHALETIVRALKNQTRLPSISSNDPIYFYLLRSRNHRDKLVVNMLLAELTPLDFRQQFICHKEAFYAQFQSWNEAKKSYTARFLAEEYLVDKVGTREELFGPEPDMLEDADEGAYVGPWGRFAGEDD